jgi:hypothetical protein
VIGGDVFDNEAGKAARQIQGLTVSRDSRVGKAEIQGKAISLPSTTFRVYVNK